MVSLNSKKISTRLGSGGGRYVLRNVYGILVLCTWEPICAALLGAFFASNVHAFVPIGNNYYLHSWLLFVKKGMLFSQVIMYSLFASCPSRSKPRDVTVFLCNPAQTVSSSYREPWAPIAKRAAHRNDQGHGTRGASRGLRHAFAARGGGRLLRQERTGAHAGARGMPSARPCNESRGSTDSAATRRYGKSIRVVGGGG